MNNRMNTTKNSRKIKNLDHVHEFSGSTTLSSHNKHNHRLAGVTDEAIPLDNGNHKHRIITNSDCTDEHYHKAVILTGPAISVGKGRHVHRVSGQTDTEDGHDHWIKFTTLENCEDNLNRECCNSNDDSTNRNNNSNGDNNNLCPPCNDGNDSTNCPFPSRVKCTCLPLDGACVPLALGHKSKHDVLTKLNRLADNTQIPSVLGAVLFESARRFMLGQPAETLIERDFYRILSGLSSDGRTVLSCCLNVIDSLPASQRDKLLSPFIKANTNLSTPTIANLLADEIVKVASQKFLGNPEAMQNPRPGLARVFPGDEIFPPTLDPFIFLVNGTRTRDAIILEQNSPTSEEVENICIINEQNQQICTAQNPPCPGNIAPTSNVCLKVHHVLGGDLVVLQGLNFFTLDAKVAIASKAQPSLRRVVPTIVYGDLDTPLVDEQGQRILDTRVKDKLIFAVPEDLPDGIYTIQVEVENKNADVLGPVPKTYISSPEFLRILPPPDTNFQILAETLNCVEETDGPGSDEVALNFFTSLITLDPLTGDIDLSTLTNREFRFNGVDSGEQRAINFAPVQANNLVGVNISIKGYEVDNEDAYRDQITELGDAFLLGMQSIWASVAGSLTTSVGTAIAIAAGATLAVGSAIVAAAALVVTVVVALIFAAWAPADPIIEDSIGLDLIQLADLTTPSLPLPPQTTTFTPEGIKVVVDSLSKDVEFKQLRGYISEDEGSLYQLIFRYSRF